MFVKLSLLMPRRQRYLAVFSFLILLSSSYYFFELLIPRVRAADAVSNRAGGYRYDSDLYPIWVGSRELFQGRDPYAPALTAQIETGLYGRPLDRSHALDAHVNMRAFAYPLYTIFLYAPIAAVPFPQVQIVISIILPALAALTVALWLRVLRTHFCWPGYLAAICLTLASYPVLEGIYAGQPGLLVALFIAGTFVALGRGQYVLAGVLLPLASVKPQLVTPIALWMLGWALSRWSERKRFLLSFLATTLVLLTASFCVLPHWYSEWMHMLLEYRLISPPPLSQSVLGRFAGGIVVLFVFSVSAWLCWKNRSQRADSEGFLLSTVFVLTATVLIFPSAIAVYDQFLLLPAALWLFTRRNRLLDARVAVRSLALLVIAVLSWQWLAAFGVVISSILFPAVAHSPTVLLLPLRTAASVPFALTGLLCVVAMRQQAKESLDSQLQA